MGLVASQAHFRLGMALFQLHRHTAAANAFRAVRCAVQQPLSLTPTPSHATRVDVRSYARAWKSAPMIVT